MSALPGIFALCVTSELRTGLIAGVSLLALLTPSGTPTPPMLSPSASHATAFPVAPLRLADFGGTAVSEPVQRIAAWTASTQDHAAKPFVIVDKQAARLYVFDSNARLLAHTAVLIGSAKGDHSAPGIGQKAIADVLPAERTTPAGRFSGQLGRNLTGEEVVWVDYEAAVSMHRVRAHQASERRLQRLASETIQDNRISYGCINVPAAFFDAHLLPVFSVNAAAIYVMPDQLSLEQVFGLVP
jgi:hypothetical protein